MDDLAMERAPDLPHAKAGALADARAVFFGLGAQKAGTSWLFEQLARHPEVHCERPSDRPKELNYWNTIRAPFTGQYRHLARMKRLEIERRLGLRRRLGLVGSAARIDYERARHYERLLNSPDLKTHGAYADYLVFTRRDEPVVGDISPWYALLGEESLTEMLALHPNVKFLFIMRDPVRRLWSGVRHRHRRMLAQGLMDARDLAKAFEAALADPLHPDRRFTDYAETIGRLDRVAPPERVACLFYESLFLPETFERVCAFLEIAPGRARETEKVNESQALDFRAPPELAAAARTTLGPVYEFVLDRFGDAVPEAWDAAGRRSAKAPA